MAIVFSKDLSFFSWESLVCTRPAHTCAFALRTRVHSSCAHVCTRPVHTNESADRNDKSASANDKSADRNDDSADRIVATLSANGVF